MDRSPGSSRPRRNAKIHSGSSLESLWRLTPDGGELRADQLTRATETIAQPTYEHEPGALAHSSNESASVSGSSDVVRLHNSLVQFAVDDVSATFPL